MRRTVTIILCLIILCIPLVFIGCAEDDTLTTAQIQKLINDAVKANSDTLKADIDAKASQKDLNAVKEDIENLPTGTNSYTKSEIDSKFNNLVENLTDSQIAILKSRLGVVPDGSNPNPNVTGQINYSIINPQTYYQFSSTGNFPLQIRIFNNKSDARYVRLQLTATTFNSQNAGTTTSTPTATVMSNSQGQTAVAFLPTATPTGAVNTVLFIANSGGVSSSGEYLLSSGSQMDIYITIEILTSNAVLWNLVISGSDRPVS